MSTYTAQTPSSNGTLVSSKTIKFYEGFYSISDNPSEDAHQTYVDQFTKDATLIMGTRSATGSDALLEFRKGLWSGPVKSRLHTLEKIFPWDKEGKEIMLYGNVLFGLANGKDHTVDWAARAVLEGTAEDDGDLKMKFYQVYLDSASVANAMKE